MDKVTVAAEQTDDVPTVQVTCRLRPLNEKELKNPDTSVPWEYSKKQIRILSKASKKTYTYDNVLAPATMNAECYDRVGKDLVAKAMSGFNATIFAYGQTGSGKTWTMMGDGARGMEGKEKGLLPRAMHDVFKWKNEHPDRIFLLRVSYMEIYNEEINDLLGREHAERSGGKSKPGKGKASWKNLRIVKSDPVRGAVISGLSEYIVESADHALEILQNGDKVRNVAGTEMNARSSRSHTIFRLVIESSLSEEARERHEKEIAKFDMEHGSGEKDGEDDFIAVKKSAKDSSDVRVSYLNLVDLAGSERQRSTKASGVRLKEGANINKSLLALGAVIKKLSGNAGEKDGSQGHTHSKTQKSTQHIPYRDSKLTRILKTSLGGCTFTHVVLAATPSPQYVEETLSTLKFGSMCKLMKNKAKVNSSSSQHSMLNEYKLQILKLKETLKEQQASGGAGESAEAVEEHKEELQKAKDEAERQKQETDDLKARLQQMEQVLAQGGMMGATDGRANIMVKSSLNYEGARIASMNHAEKRKLTGWDKLKRVVTTRQSQGGDWETNQQMYQTIKELEDQKAEAESEKAELAERVEDLEHEAEALRTEAEETSAKMEEFQQHVEEFAHRSSAEAEEREQLEQLLVAKDTKILREEKELDNLKHMLLEKESHIKLYVKQEGLRKAEINQLQQVRFLVKIRKRAIAKMLEEVERKQIDHEDAVTMLNYEISSKEEHLENVQKSLDERKEELDGLIENAKQKYNSKRLEWKAKDESVKEEEKKAEKMRHDLELKLESLNRDIKLHDVLPALQRRVRRGQQERLHDIERRLLDREKELKETHSNFVQEKVAHVEQSKIVDIEARRLKKWNLELVMKAKKLHADEDHFNAKNASFMEKEKELRKEQRRLSLEQKEVAKQSGSFHVMENVLLQREKEMDTYKRRLEQQMHEHRKSEERLLSTAKAVEMDRKHLEHSHATGKHAALVHHKLKSQISSLEDDLERSLGISASYRERLALAEKKLFAIGIDTGLLYRGKMEEVNATEAESGGDLQSEDEFAQLDDGPGASEISTDEDSANSAESDPEDDYHVEREERKLSTKPAKNYASWMDENSDYGGSSSDEYSSGTGYDYDDHSNPPSDHSSSVVNVVL